MDRSVITTGTFVSSLAGLTPAALTALWAAHQVRLTAAGAETSNFKIRRNGPISNFKFSIGCGAPKKPDIGLTSLDWLGLTWTLDRLR